ncbi:MAG: [Oscillospiraceae bacterium]|nr:[FeFe] hydrogenase H-cluster radical SAM maturase HydE [Oscillospiraceae bacterium]
MRSLVEKLCRERVLSEEEFIALIQGRDPQVTALLAQRAAAVRRKVYGDRVFIRGLIEFTNHCKNDCYYCGLRCSDRVVERYRLSEEEILGCCHRGYEMGFRTFVLQGGEDPGYPPERICALVARIKEAHPDCAVTLSVGEQPREVYQSWFDAGADRYLLRHETADGDHYGMLHPARMKLGNRLRCLRDLKDIGYQVGCGFMVGSPGQRPAHIARDLAFIHELQPHMVGIGPFIPQKDTPFGKEKAGSAELTVYLLSIIRLMLPNVLLPATTALGTIHPRGRELGIAAGANVCMPNLSPLAVRKKYAIYDDKICTGDEAAECIRCLRGRIESVGCVMDMGRGDHVTLSGKEVDRYV